MFSCKPFQHQHFIPPGSPGRCVHHRRGSSGSVAGRLGRGKIQVQQVHSTVPAEVSIAKGLRWCLTQDWSGSHESHFIKPVKLEGATEIDRICEYDRHRQVLKIPPANLVIVSLSLPLISMAISSWGRINILTPPRAGAARSKPRCGSSSCRVWKSDCNLTLSKNCAASFLIARGFHMQESCLSLLEGFMAKEDDWGSWKIFRTVAHLSETKSSIPFQNLFIWQWSWYHSHHFFRSKSKILPGSALKRVTHLLRDFKWRFSLPAGHDG